MSIWCSTMRNVTAVNEDCVGRAVGSANSRRMVDTELVMQAQTDKEVATGHRTGAATQEVAKSRERTGCGSANIWHCSGVSRAIHREEWPTSGVRSSHIVIVQGLGRG